MFTGIIEETGRVRSVAPGRISISAAKVLDGTKAGDSIAVNGVCLTVTSVSPSFFCADVMAETLARSALGSLRQGDPVNLERAVLASSRLGGHLVAGHVDGTGTVRSIGREGIASVFTIACGRALTALMAVKGSVAVDGVSLTLCSVRDDSFSVSVIPHTLGATCLGLRRAGSAVNVECDLLARYAAAGAGAPPSGVTTDAGIARRDRHARETAACAEMAADGRLYSALLARGFITGGQ